MLLGGWGHNGWGVFSITSIPLLALEAPLKSQKLI
jgi:hypothetical protein